MKDISKIIKEFENLSCKVYVRERPKHELNVSYFYLARQLANCVMRADSFNLNVEPVRTEMDGTQQIMIWHDCDSDDSKSKVILAVKNYHKSILRTTSNQKSLSLMKALHKRVNQKASIKVSTQIRKNMQSTKKRTRNIW